ncbi:hypothetical protein [Pseudovibrio sp. Ad26]|uniref:hypothetical protein n=1 Tax=Pseudovibrio sp. Ad26 TaxID=989410 RepID=UPI0007B185E1|nr:hypothetical protein [Pseudovibrio sp. Ad26]KZL06388.1 hypothetical protein PsAD26_03639 [Pseudovibrio sp. Ad26]
MSDEVFEEAVIEVHPEENLEQRAHNEVLFVLLCKVLESLTPEQRKSAVGQFEHYARNLKYGDRTNDDDCEVVEEVCYQYLRQIRYLR